jgi:hypothetical protein
MPNAPRSVLNASRPKPMAACVAAIFSLSPLGAYAASTWTVTSCADSGPGSLRDTIAAATTLSGDTVDLRQLPTTYGCSAITLETGAIAISQSSLTLQGPGIDSLAISGQNSQQVLTHTGVGSVSIDDLSITNGYAHTSYAAAKGGCIYSAGTMLLKHVNVAGCRAYTDSGTALGGGIFAANGLTLEYSALESNIANGGYAGSAEGGGAFTFGPFESRYSTVTANQAKGKAYGGGLYLLGNATIIASTISGNRSENNIGGLSIVAISPENLTATISNSTISGNSAAKVIGGVYANFGTIKINNSTIAFNTARYATIPPSFNYYAAPGLATTASRGSIAMTVQSTLISNNTAESVENAVESIEDDFSINSVVPSGNTIAFVSASANNLIRVADQYSNSILPNDTITGSCPLLGPLRDNGGVTKTHALLSTSPAIDRGNNTSALNEDQRGLLSDALPYAYSRQSGNAADIGSYEVQKDDVIFNADWEGCLAAAPD